MNGTHPGAVTGEEIIAYLEGEAPPHVAQHVETCDECTSTARTFADTQQRLRRYLHRFACPSTQTLGEFELGVLTPVERSQVAIHVADCPRCVEELRSLREFLASDTTFPQPTRGLVERIVATLLPQPRVAAAAIRGTDDLSTQTYQAGNVRISLDAGVVGPRGGPTTLTGLIWREDVGADPVAGGIAALIASSGVEQHAEIDALGNFTMDAVEPGTYRLEVGLANQRIVIEHVRING